MARKARTSALKVAKNALDDRLKRGRGNTDDKLDDYFSRNIGNSAFEHGLEQARDRFASFRGSPINSSTPLEDVFKAVVKSKKGAGTSLREALDKTLKSEVFRGAMATDNFMDTWKTAMGESQPIFDPKGKLQGSTPELPSWVLFKQASGWTGSEDDYKNLDWDGDGMIYTNKKGDKFKLWFSDSPKQAEYTIL